jgi:ABC-type phosphate/phosphonate transport system substrate-binding protein
MREALRTALLTLPDDVLHVGQVSRLVPVHDADYDPIRHMARIAHRLPRWTLEQPVS